eukprot:10083977-Prorocentrum_lima.AAC.1
MVLKKLRQGLLRKKKEEKRAQVINVLSMLMMGWERKQKGEEASEELLSRDHRQYGLQYMAKQL